MPVIHYRPTDSNESEVWQQEFNKKDATEENSLFVHEIPNPISQRGKTHTLFIKLTDNTLFYKYEDRPLTTDEKLEEAYEKIEMMQSVLDEIILTGSGF